MAFSTWLGFFLTCIVLAVSPGPGAMASMNAGLAHGRRGLRLVAGLQAALLLQLGAVALGAGALLLASETAFHLARWAGALYLVWLGINRWRTRESVLPVGVADAGDGEVPVSVGPARGLFRRGLLVNLSNPKAIIFMAALVPPFIQPDLPLLPQYLLLAATICGVDSVVMGGYVGLASRFRPWLADTRRQRWQNRVFGSIFVGLGLALLASDVRSR